MELPNQERIRILGEKEIFKYLGVLEADTIKQVGMKKIKIKKSISDEHENFLKSSSATEISSKR